MTWRDVWPLLRRTFEAWNEDKVPRLGAALAYYALFSMAPLLMMAVAIAGLVFGEAAARGEVVGRIRAAVGDTVAEAIEGMLKSIYSSGGSTAATITGLALLLFGASAMLMQLQDALNTIWEVTPPAGRGVLGIVRDRFLSFLLVLGAGLLLMSSLALSTALAATSKLWDSAAVPGGPLLWQGVHWLVSLAFTALLFALTYKVLPDVHLPWRDAWVGAAVTAILFTVGQHLVGWYLGQGSTTSAFGAAASLVVILLWVYYSSQILLLGAEFTRVYASMRASPVAPRKGAVPVSESALAAEGTPRATPLAGSHDRKARTPA